MLSLIVSLQTIFSATRNRAAIAASREQGADSVFQVVIIPIVVLVAVAIGIGAWFAWNAAEDTITDGVDQANTSNGTL